MNDPNASPTPGPHGPPPHANGHTVSHEAPPEPNDLRARLAKFGGISGVSIRRPVFISMVMIGLVVLGLFSFSGLAIDQYPDVDIPILTVQTVYPGASPETIEREVTRRLEEAFNPIQGVDKITSVSLEGVSQVIVEFELERKVDDAAQDVRAKIEGIRRLLPADIETPIVQKFDPSAQPIVSLAVSSSSLPISSLTTLADETIRRQLETVSGVGEVQIAGGLEREIRINLLPERLQALGVTVNEVTAALQQQNLEAPAGRVERGSREQLVRVTGRIADVEGFKGLIVATRGDTPIRLSEVANVLDATEEERSVALVDGQRAVSLDVLKVSGANTVNVAEGVIEAVHAIQKDLPAGTELQVIRDNSVTIRSSVDDVLFELVLGALLTIVIVMLFLNDGKATIITSLALPVSVISSFILMQMLGFTLNILTLMGLSLSIGILIDDAIVVIENIVRHRQLGADKYTAAGEGTREIFLAVLATTLTIVAVFVPVAFMGGIIGRFFFQFGMTVAWAVLVSLFVSFTLTPMLAAHWGVEPHVEGAAASRNPLKRGISAFNRWFDRGAAKYSNIISWALGHRKMVLALAAASFVGAIALFPLIGGAFMPAQDVSEFAVQFETPDGSSLSYTRSKAEQIGATLGTLPGVDYTYTTVGAGATGTVTSGNVFVKLVPPGERDESQDELIVRAREALRPVLGANVAVLAAGGMGGATAPIQVEVRGPDVAVLQTIAAQVEGVVKGTPGVVDVKNSLGQPRPEFRIDVKRELANDLGLNIGSIAATVRPILAGQTVTTWQDPTGEERNVVVQVDAAQRRSVEDIARIPVATTTRRAPDGGYITVPLSQIARIEEGTAPAQIDRKSLQRVATVSASMTPDVSLSEASDAISARLDALPLPEGYSASLGGETEQLAETMGSVIQAIALAIILIFLILASQFESFTQPIAIMIALPLSLVGVLLALLLTNDTLNMMSLIGVILLMGLVTKNAILIVDNVNERRTAGKDRFTAVVEAGQVRLRPIIMTTLAMIAGMVPIAMALGEGGAFRAPMARAVIGGLITSTLLTLIVVPVMYTYLDDFATWTKTRFSKNAPATDDASDLMPDAATSTPRAIAVPSYTPEAITS